MNNLFRYLYNWKWRLCWLTQGRSQPHSPGWASVTLPQIKFSYFSSNSSHFLPQPTREGPTAKKKKKKKCLYLNTVWHLFRATLRYWTYMLLLHCVTTLYVQYKNKITVGLEKKREVTIRRNFTLSICVFIILKVIFDI